MRLLKIKISPRLKYLLGGSLATLALIGLGHLGFNAYQDSQVPIHISASSSLYQSVRRNHLDYLHRVGNRQARDTNWNHAKFLHGYRGGFNDNHSYLDGKHQWSVYHFYKHNKIYHADKYGNYWSWFEDHQAIGNDEFDIANTYNRLGVGNHPALTSYSKKKSGIMASEQVLRDHGVKSGVNFVKFNQIDHVPGYN